MKKTNKKSKATKAAKPADSEKSAKSADEKAAPESETPPETADATPDKSPETAGETVSESPPEVSSGSSDPLAGYDRDALRDLYMRAVAENKNIQQRAESEIRKTRDFAVLQFSRGICEVCDCLDSALAESKDSAAEKDDAMHEGVALTLRKLTVVMENNGIRSVRPDEGASFDPALHQAVGVNPDSTRDANTVAIVVQCGYTLNGRMIRPANVIVNKPPENKTEDKTD